MPEAMEVTTFKLINTSFDGFIAANAGIDRWLQMQPGFRSRRLARRADGTVVDILLWETAEHGEDAAARIMTETAAAAAHALIDYRTVDWDVSQVSHRITAEGLAAA